MFSFEIEDIRRQIGCRRRAGQREAERPQPPVSASIQADRCPLLNAARQIEQAGLDPVADPRRRPCEHQLDRDLAVAQLRPSLEPFPRERTPRRGRLQRKNRVPRVHAAIAVHIRRVGLDTAKNNR